MTRLTDWRSWVVGVPGDGRAALISYLADRIDTPWYWVDLETRRGLWMEIGMHVPAVPFWTREAADAGLIDSATERDTPILFEPSLFPAARCPAVWGDLLAVTSARAAVMAVSGPVDRVEIVAEELALIYGGLSPAEQRPRALRWHLNWLTGTVNPAAMNSSVDQSMAPVPTVEFIASDLRQGLFEWSAELAPTSTWTGPEPAWIPTVARLAHVQALRLTADGNATLERAALQMLTAS